MNVQPSLFAQIKSVLHAAPNFSARFFSKQTELVDAVQYWAKRNQQEFLLKPAEDFISKRLSHISVNPHDATNTELLKRSYVFSPHGPEISEEGAQLLNRDESRVRDILDRIIAKAQERRELSIEPPDDAMAVFTQDHIFYVIGDRGCGKTFFLNYALSKHDSYLDDKKVIWVRVNLVPNRGFDDNLYAWIEAQIAKIALRYYEVTSKFRKKEYTKIDLITHVRKWINTTPRIDDLDRARHRDNLTEMLEAFCETTKDVEISRGLCDRLICQELFAFLRTSDYSFIIVLDGLDVLDIDRHHSERFANIETSFRKLLSTYERYGAAFVIVARRVTFRETISTSPYFTAPSNHLFYINDSDFDEVLKKRIDAIRYIFRVRARDGDSEHDWDAILSDFLVRFSSMVHDDYLLKKVTKMEFLAKNNRERMQLVQFAFQAYLQNKTGLGYRLIEHMAKAGFEYPPVIYYYRRKENDESFEISSVHTGSYDSRILPIITRCPCNMSEGFRVVDNFNGCHVLHGIRALQILRISHELRRRNEQFEELTIREFCRLLHILFDYEPARTMAYVRELEAYQTIQTYDAGNVAPGSQFGRIRLIAKGDFVLLKCLFDIAYLNLCAMRTPVKVEALERRYIRLAKYDPSSRNSAENWITVKSCNSLSLAVVLMSGNERQLTELQTKASQTERELSSREKLIFRMGQTNNYFDFSSEMRSTILAELQRILSAPRDARSADLTSDATSAVSRLIADIR